MLLTIQTGTDNPILRQQAVKVKQVDKRLKKLIKDMIKTMLKKDGVGLAAPQVGVSERLIILNFQIDKKEFRPIALVNPEIVDASITTDTAEEGCLSLPDVFGKVVRFSEVTVRFTDEGGSEHTLQLDKLNARAVQHEIDHLDGILFVDRVKGKGHLPDPAVL